MARRNTRSNRRNITPVYSSGRDYLPIANNLLLPRFPIHNLRNISPIVFEDFRRYNPAPVRRSPLRTSGRSAVIKNQVRPGGLSLRSSFVDPNRVMICVRRQIRREVLHAKGYSGRNGSRTYKKSSFHHVAC